MSTEFVELVSISVDYSVIDQLVVRYSAVVRCLKKKWEYNRVVN